MRDPIEWYPGRMLRSRAEGEGSAPRFALIILNQPLNDVPTLKTLWDNASLKVAADGGANRLLQARKPDNERDFDDLDVVIGDLDSLTPATWEYFATRPRPARVIRDPDQGTTDFGKAVAHVRASAAAPSSPPGPVDIVAVGGLGGRVDQGLSQLHHLYLFQADPEYTGGRMFLVSGESLTFLLKTGRHRVHVREKDASGGLSADAFDKYVGIVPVKEPSVISTKGLEWDVEDWKTEFGGMVSTSNHVLPATEVVEVETTKDVLFTIALKA